MLIVVSSLLLARSMYYLEISGFNSGTVIGLVIIGFFGALCLSIGYAVGSKPTNQPQTEKDIKE